MITSLSLGDRITVIEPTQQEVAIIDEIIKNRVKNRISQEKQKVYDKIEQEFVEEIIGPIEKSLDVPIGKYLGYNQRLILNYDARFTEFDPLFETQNWGGPTTEDVKAALQPVFDLMWRDFNKTAINEKISIFRGGSNPYISTARRGGVLFQRIRLSVEGAYYQQYVYQFAHELGHLLTNYEERSNSQFNWLDETFAELASAYVIMKFANESPYQQFDGLSWAAYFNAIYESHNYELERNYTIYSDSKAVEWLDENIMNALEHNCCYRELNWGVARELLPHFLADPNMWQSVGQMNKWDERVNENLDEYLDDWYWKVKDLPSGRKFIDLMRTVIPEKSRKIKL